MDALATDSYFADDDSSLVQYEVAFREMPKHLGSKARVLDLVNDAHVPANDVKEELSNTIKWESHVDEADRLDYIVAVSSGVLAGLIDVLYTGEFSLDRASEWGTEKIEKVVMEVAHVEGFDGNNPNDAIGFLEKNHRFAADGNINDFGGGLQHHLRDFSHHFSIGGLFFSMFTQFTGLVVGTDKAGVLHVVPVPESHRACIGKNFQEKVAFGTIGWFFHMVSDMAGSSSSLMGGIGIPGPLVSFIKEISALPFFRESDEGDMTFRLWVTKLFNGTLLAERDENGRIKKGGVKKFDLRTEIGILGEIGRQMTSVLINQCMVRSFYFCRRLAREIRDLDVRRVTDLGRIAPEDILPWGTPAMRRMVSVSSGVFFGVDIADAAVRAIKSKNPVNFFLRVNYIGVATFVIACVVDINGVFEDKRPRRGVSPEEAYEYGLSDLGCLKLDFMQARILHSIEYALVAYDIAAEKHPKRAAKKLAWLKEWSERITEAVDLVWAADTEYFLDDDLLYGSIDARLGNESNDSWLWLVALEAVRFRPFVPLHGEKDKLYRGLKLSSNYLDDVFCEKQEVVDKRSLSKMDKAVRRAKERLDGTVAKRVVGTAGTAAAVVASGGLAFYFAPAVAPSLAAALGLEVASLHGAALTSASLAFLGGGALAAGGAGMAGGTMLIAGGGALLGAIGGSGVSAVTSMALATNGSYVLEECAKLVVFCDEVLIKRYGDFVSVAEIHTMLNRRIVEIDVRVEALKHGVSEDLALKNNDDGLNDMDEMSPRRALKVLKRSRKFMRRSSNELVRALSFLSQRRAALPAVD